MGNCQKKAEKIKIAALGGWGVFLISLLPIIYLAPFDRASGDDYGYGVYTHLAWISTHSLLEVLKAIGRTIRQYYFGWQGTWFSITLFTLQPEVFSEKAYFIVPVLMLLLWIGSVCYLFCEILVYQMKWNRWGCQLIMVVFLFLNLQFVPGKKSSLFWFNGCAHYMIPFTMCLFLAGWLLKWGRTHKKRYVVGIFLFLAVLGGSNYQAALLALLITVYYGFYRFCFRKDKTVLWLLAPIGIELVGLIISMLAPGNKLRGGETFGFSVINIIQTVGMCFVKGGTDAWNYLIKTPLVLMGMLFIAVLFIKICSKTEESFEAPIWKHPLWSSLLLVCMYCAMQAPELYANVEVSQGVPNTNFQVLLLTLAGILLILSVWWAQNRKRKNEKYYKHVFLLTIVLLIVGGVIFRHDIKETTDYICYEYIVSGQAADYKKQMDLQTKLLLDTEVTDVVLPGINDWQGPLMQMPVTEDADAWTNQVTAHFYGKNSVVAIPRTEWKEKYEQGE